MKNLLQEYPLILAESGVAQRMKTEFGIAPDPDVAYSAAIYSEDGRSALRHIYGEYLQVAQDFGLPLLLLTNTRRANRERVLRSRWRDRDVNADFAEFLRETAAAYRCASYVCGMMGCPGNAYSAEENLPREQALEFHAWQAERFAKAPVDFLFAAIMPELEEGLALADVMSGTGKPYFFSFMVNRKGLLDGHTIAEAIATLERNAHAKPLGYMANCVHPDILLDALSQQDTPQLRERFIGLQANAACLTPEELDDSCDLHSSSPEELLASFQRLTARFPLRILGGCCGTDARHLREIARHYSKRMEENPWQQEK